MQKRIALIDDHPMLIRGLSNMLECQADLNVMGSYLSAEAFLQACPNMETQPEILLMDISMPGMNGEALATTLQEQYPSIMMIVFTNMEQRYYLRSMIRKGVLGYVLKSSSEFVLLEAIRTVHKGSFYFDPVLREEGLKILKAEESSGTQPLVLTDREKEVLQLIMEDYNSHEIGQQLFISKRTVDFHRTNLLLKLDAKTPTAMLKKAIDLGLIK
jgi:DNA-binding NarL/FixJ family response regulator